MDPAPTSKDLRPGGRRATNGGLVARNACNKLVSEAPTVHGARALSSTADPAGWLLFEMCGPPAMNGMHSRRDGDTITACRRAAAGKSHASTPKQTQLPSLCYQLIYRPALTPYQDVCHSEAVPPPGALCPALEIFWGFVALPINASPRS